MEISQLGDRYNEKIRFSPYCEASGCFLNIK